MSEEKKSGYLFVYGTLKKGEHRFQSIEDIAVSVKDTEYLGAKMYDLGAFPGIRLNTTGRVYGQLIEVNDIAEALRRCDRIEGYRPDRPQRENLYNRRTIRVDGVDAYTYEYNCPPEVLEERGVIVIEQWMSRVYAEEENEPIPVDDYFCPNCGEIMTKCEDVGVYACNEPDCNVAIVKVTLE